MQAGITQMESILGAVDGAIDMSTAMGIDVGMVHEVLDGLADDAVNLFGGFDLWKSQDGRYWFPVTVSGFGSTVNSLTGNYKQVGVRRLVEANNKMYIGTASFYGDGFEVLQGKVTEY